MTAAVHAALSLSDEIEKYGAYAGLASVLGLGVLALLYFAQAREVKRLREWAGRAPERAAELEARVAADAQRRVQAQPQPAAAQAPPAASPGTPAPGAPAPAAATAGAAVLATRPAAPTQAQDTTIARPGENGAPAKPGEPVPAGGPAPATAAARAGAKPAAPKPGEDAKPGAEAKPDEQAEPGKEAEQGDKAPAPAAAADGAAAAAAATPAGAAATPPAAPPAAPPGLAPPPAAAPPAPAPAPAPAVARPAPAPAPAPAARPAPAPRPQPAAPLRAPAAAATLPPRTPAGAARSRAGARGEGHSRGRRALAWTGGLVAVAAAAVVLFAVVLGGDDEAPPAPNRVAPSDTATEPATGQGSGGATAGVDRAGTTVAVLNGTTITGLARGAADRITKAGYVEGTVSNDTTNQSRQATVVMYADGRRRAALDVARIIDVERSAVQPLDQGTRLLAGEDADVVVSVGSDKAQQ